MNNLLFVCFREGDLLQCAGVPGGSLLGHAGGEGVSAVPQRRPRYTTAQVLHDHS